MKTEKLELETKVHDYLNKLCEIEINFRQRRMNTTIVCNESTEGETIENKIRRATEEKTPIEDGAPVIYQSRSEGVNPEMNPRGDKWEIAQEASGRTAKARLAQRAEYLEQLKPKQPDVQTPE